MPHRLFPNSEKVQDSIETGEPVVGTPLMDAWLEADLPARGKYRRRILKRIRDNTRERRSMHMISERIASTVTSPVTSAIDDEIRETATSVVMNQVERRFIG